MRHTGGTSWVLLLVSLALAGCQTQGGEGNAGAAHVQVRVGTLAAASRASATRATETGQRAGDIPPEVVQIILRVTTRERSIPGSPFTIPLETRSTSVDIAPNQDHRFVIEAQNARGEAIFHGTQTVN